MTATKPLLQFWPVVFVTQRFALKGLSCVRDRAKTGLRNRLNDVLPELLQIKLRESALCGIVVHYLAVLCKTRATSDILVFIENGNEFFLRFSFDFVVAFIH